MKALKLYFPVYCKVHGVSCADRQGAITQSRAGDKLQIVHLPTPEHPYNVFVYSITLNRVLEFCRDAIIENITGGAPMYEMKGCNICIFNSAAFLNDEIDFQALHGA